MSVITSVRTADIRFPTSADLDGSDAMNPDPDYSAAYVVISTDSGDELEGHAFAFTIGRGNDVQVMAIEAVAQCVLGRDVEALLADMGATWSLLNSDSQLRWLGPEKSVIHMAAGAVINALWDLKAKRAGLPLWQLLSRLSPEEIADLIDFRYLTDALTRSEAVEILTRAVPSRGQREEALLVDGYPAYTTSPGWLGYSDEKLARLCAEAIAEGYPQIKLKVGSNVNDDRRRLAIAREVCGDGFPLAIDANQRWDVDTAIEWITALEEFDLAWVEEPTSPDDVLGHAAIARGVHPIRIATGEHVHNRVMFKQFIQAGGMHVVQIDAARVGGVNENIAIILLAAKYGLPICPHAGGVGLCEAVQHLAMFDFVAVSGDATGRMIEYVDHLHEHFVSPTRVVRGRYLAPMSPGASTEMRASTLHQYAWRELRVATTEG